MNNFTVILLSMTSSNESRTHVIMCAAPAVELACVGAMQQVSRELKASGLSDNEFDVEVLVALHGIAEMAWPIRQPLASV